MSIKYIAIPLSFLLLLTIFNSVLFFSFSLTGGTNSTYITGNQTLNGTSMDISGVGVIPAYFDATTGALGIFFVAVSLGIIAGIKAVGSGLGEFADSIIFNVSAYMGLWGALSVIGASMLTAIPYFGWFAYLILTIVYVLGVVQSIKGG